jgi:predicted PurR-regulated permease PerM
MQLSSEQKRQIAWLLIASLLGYMAWLLMPVLTPFVVALVLAYALTPVVNWLDRLGKGRIPRVLVVVIVELWLLLVVTGIFLLMVPIIAKELPLMREQLPTMMDSVNAAIKPWLAQWGFHWSLNGTNLKTFVLKYLSTNVEDATASLLTSLKMGGSVAFTVVGNAVLIPVALFYLLMDWERIMTLLHELIPPRMRGNVENFLADVNQVLGQYMRGQLLVMLILAGFYSLGLTLFGLDLALPIGIFTGLAMFVPYVGFGVGLVLAIFAGLLQFTAAKGLSPTILMIGVVYGGGQLLEGFFLTPRLVGERIGLHPLAVIFALLAFGQLLGFVGVLIALPVSAVLLVAIRRLRAGYLASPLYHAPH